MVSLVIGRNEDSIEDLKGLFLEHVIMMMPFFFSAKHMMIVNHL